MSRGCQNCASLGTLASFSVSFEGGVSPRKVRPMLSPHVPFKLRCGKPVRPNQGDK